MRLRRCVRNSVLSQLRAQRINVAPGARAYLGPSQSGALRAPTSMKHAVSTTKINACFPTIISATRSSAKASRNELFHQNNFTDVIYVGLVIFCRLFDVFPRRRRPENVERGIYPEVPPVPHLPHHLQRRIAGSLPVASQARYRTFASERALERALESLRKHIYSSWRPPATPTSF